MKKHMVYFLVLMLTALAVCALSGCGNEPEKPLVIMDKNDGKLFSKEARDSLEEDRKKFAAEVEAYKKKQAERREQAEREREELLKKEPQK